MEETVGVKAINRAIASLDSGGLLELGFFGGEPLLEPHLISKFINHARERTSRAGVGLRLSITTNGTRASDQAWALMALSDLDLAISHDGLPEIHDRHRRDAHGRGSSFAVEATIARLHAAGKAFRVVMVVRPDTLDSLSQGIEYLRKLGIHRIELAPDLWTKWSREDGPRLEAAIAVCADLWRSALPDLELNWFDEKAARLAGCELTETARCSFGKGQIAVAPSGRLYPCERLIGEDSGSNPMLLPGHATEGNDFLSMNPAEGRCATECRACKLEPLCGTTCRCSNYTRTGQIGHPDGLLCLLEQVCIRETARVLGARPEFVTISG